MAKLSDARFPCSRAFRRLRLLPSTGPVLPLANLRPAFRFPRFRSENAAISTARRAMEEAEGFYGTLCSLETLRSGKKGFFRDFSENVTRVAGEQWIAKVFGRLTSDEQRIRSVFTDAKIKDTVLETLNRTELLYRGKDANASRARRLEGFEAAAAGQPRKASLLFSQAVLRAPLPGKDKTVDRGHGLALALLARAENLLSRSEHALALRDLTLAEEMGVPDESRAELTRTKERCEQFFGANEKGLVLAKASASRGRTWTAAEDRPLPRVSGGENPDLPAASALLNIEETKNAGKRAVAAQRIDAGDRLVVESPLAATLLPEFFGTHCQHCFSRFEAPLGCPDCSSVAFCGPSCRDAAMASYHKYECKVLALLIGSGMSVLSMLALRMVTQSGPIECSKASRALGRCDSPSQEPRRAAAASSESREPSKLGKSAKRRARKKKLQDRRREEKLESDAGIGAEPQGVTNGERRSEGVDLRAYDLVTHEKRRTAKDFFHRSLMAAFLLKCLQRVGFFEEPTKDEVTPAEQEIAVASLLLKHLQLLQFNAHEVFETRLGAQHRFRGSKPIYLGVAIYPTVARFNHDCYPAVTRYFLGRSIVIRAIRSLLPGDTVAENYGPIFTKRSLEERRRTLAGRYWFRCECTACRENWPSFDALTNDHVRLRCPTEGCPQLHRRPRDPSRRVECSFCRRKVHLEERLNRVRECEQLYARGFTEMEKERPERALEAFFEAASKFHGVAVPPHRDTHLAEIAASACMADEGNVYQPDSFL